MSSWRVLNWRVGAFECWSVREFVSIIFDNLGNFQFDNQCFNFAKRAPT